MKKVLYYFLVIAFLLLTSCTNDTSDSSDPTDFPTDSQDDPDDDSDDDDNSDDSEDDDDLDNNPNSNTANAVKYGDKEFKLSHGFEEQFKFKSKDNHSGGQINIADGDFFATTLYVSGRAHLVWRPKKASVWLYTKMYSPGTGGLSDDTYEFMPKKTDERDPSLANTSMFSDGKFAVDINNDGDVESDDGEFLDITGGTIEFKVSGDNYTVIFDLTLENGMKASGSFTGDFIQVDAA